MLSPVHVSVVVPSHDTRDLTLACVASLERAGDVEVLVVDDGSTDGTATAIAKRFPRVGVLRNSQAFGFTAAVNRGLAVARGRILVLLNSDSEVEPRGLEALEAAFAAQSRLGVAGAELRYPDGRPQWSAGREPDLVWLFALASGIPSLLARIPGYRRWRPLSARARGGVDWVTGAAVAFRRSVWEAIGPFDEDFQFYTQDLDFCLRAQDAGWGVEVVQGFRVVHHHGATIGQKSGSVGPENPRLLWNDLLRWAKKRRGPGWARLARMVLLIGGLARIAGRCLVWPFRPGDRRAYSADSRAFAEAVGSLLRAAS